MQECACQLAHVHKAVAAQGWRHKVCGVMHQVSTAAVKLDASKHEEDTSSPQQ